LYESAIGVSVDGVVGMDPTALGELASVTGPIEQPGYGVKLDTDNTADVLNHDVYLHFSGRPDDRDTYVAGVIEEFWRRMSSPSARVGALPSSLPSVVASQHFKVYSGIPKDERSLADLEADGDYRSQGSAVQAVFHNNLTDNKIDYFLERRVDTSIQLGTEGRAAVTTEATMENAAVAGPSSDFLGAGNKPSTNRMRLSFLLPRRAKVKGYGRNDNRVSYETGEEGGFPLVSDDVKVPAGETVAATLDYTMRIAALRKDRGTFRITLFPHGTITPDELSLEISPPDGYSFTTPDGPGTLEANGTFFYSGSATAPVEVELQLVRD
nr:DUF4012 domain-containing protein [Actinomycetota bacterium]